MLWAKGTDGGGRERVHCLASVEDFTWCFHVCLPDCILGQRRHCAMTHVRVHACTLTRTDNFHHHPVNTLNIWSTNTTRCYGSNYKWCKNEDNFKNTELWMKHVSYRSGSIPNLVSVFFRKESGGGCLEKKVVIYDFL